MVSTSSSPSWHSGAVALFKIRVALGVFIFGLIVSGVTAFPLLGELNLLVRWINAGPLAAGTGHFASLARWILRVRDGLDATYAAFPFIAYGTDWLAFGHIIIALFFFGPVIDPVRNVFVLRVGLLSCALVIPLALICGPIREIPLFWRMVDCSFGFVGAPILWYRLRLTRQLETRPAFIDPLDDQ